MKYTETHLSKAHAGLLWSTINWLRWLKTHILQITGYQLEVTVRSGAYGNDSGAFLVVPIWDMGAIGIQRVETRDYALFSTSTMYRRAPRMQNYPLPT